MASASGADRDQADRVGAQLTLPVQGLQHALQRQIGTDHNRSATAPMSQHPVEFGRALRQCDLHVRAPAEHVPGDPDRLAVGLPGRRVEQDQQLTRGVRIDGAVFGRGQRRHDRSFLR
ncbi:hypothetical protein ACFQ0T_20800 [Kitasatospora gansuensis]